MILKQDLRWRKANWRKKRPQKKEQKTEKRTKDRKDRKYKNERQKQKERKTRLLSDQFQDFCKDWILNQVIAVKISK